jgi:glycosyltransferase involved in cell wall biosynthesis
VVRGLYRTLAQTKNLQPLVWDDICCNYSTPTEGEFRYLTTPFAQANSSSARPNQKGVSAADFVRTLWHHSQQSLDWENTSPNSVLLLPEVFRDSRILYLPRPAQIPMPVVAWFHDACALQLGPTVPEAKTRRFERYLRYLSKCHRIITISEYSRRVFIEWCAKHAIQPPPIHVLHLPIEFPGDRITVPQPPDSDRIQILFVSSLTYNKNHLALLQACQQLWDRGLEFDLHLVGKVDAAWADSVLPTLQHAQAHYPVYWHKHITDEALQERYRQCHFTVYPSLCEGYGLPVLESFWFAKPCLIPDTGAIREVAANGGCHYFSLEKPDSLSHAIEELITSPELRNKLANQSTRQQFPQWKEYCHQLSAILDSVVADYYAPSA